MPWVKWGCALADFDNDGWPDCFFVNGHVDNNRREIGQPVDYEEIPLLFRNMFGTGTSASAWRPATPGLTSTPSTSAAEPPSATSTTTATSISWSTTRTPRPPCCATTPSRANHWIRFILEGTKSNRDAIGTKLVVDGGRANHLPPAQGRLQHAGAPTITVFWSGLGRPPRSKRP